MARVQREIGVASGILMATGKLSADEAFAELYRASQRLHRDLPEVARHVTATGRLPDESDDLRPQG
jgi:AmiR/NasT family two-component response regulator